ncbi:MAG: class I SAM-dependent methyltransferase [Candidatus Delongbacteria bacterium]|nr:class I SAM-dependent methyltransferase [Candidatus Delongbacteria bacterium]
MKCRNCGHPLSEQFIDLINCPPSNAYLESDDLNSPEVFYPLRLFVCDQCWLVQVDEYKKAHEIFSDDYAYFSSYSSSWLDHCRRYTDMIRQRLNLDSSSLVVEVASNDGYLLQYFKQAGIQVLGIEPTRGTAEIAISKGIDTMIEFFGTDLAWKLAADGRQADLIVGNNVLAHVPDLHDFVGGIRILLKDHAIATFEFPHLYQLVLNNQFDTIYHEHFSYFSLHAVQQIMADHDLTVVDVEEIPTHGGSLRLYVQPNSNPIPQILPSVNDLLNKESQAGMLETEYYQSFYSRVEQVKLDLLSLVIEIRRQHKKIVAYGAAAKGNTLLNFCGIRKDWLDYVVDRSPHKQGKFLPASHIPVLSPECIRQDKPDYVLILPWNIKNEIMDQLNYIREWGGRFIIPIPSIQVV